MNKITNYKFCKGDNLVDKNIKQIGTTSKTYHCKENNNVIKLIFEDGRLDEVHFSDFRVGSWIVFGIEDLKATLSKHL